MGGERAVRASAASLAMRRVSAGQPQHALVPAANGLAGHTRLASLGSWMGLGKRHMQACARARQRQRRSPNPRTRHQTPPRRSARPPQPRYLHTAPSDPPRARAHARCTASVRQSSMSRPPPPRRTAASPPAAAPTAASPVPQLAPSGAPSNTTRTTAIQTTPSVSHVFRSNASA